MELLDSLKTYKIVAIARRVPADRIVDAAKALAEGGIRHLEITFDQQDPACLTLTPAMIEAVRRALDGAMFVGAGTVLTVAQAEAAHAAGASFALAPDVQVPVIRRVKELGMVSVPGAMTPTEITTAWNAGADIVKVFPAGVLGLPYLKAVRGPVSHVPLMAVGGVDLANARAFLQGGCMSLGIGSCLVDGTLIRERKWKELTALAEKFVKECETV